jgi:hypothetical protein
MRAAGVSPLLGFVPPSAGTLKRFGDGRAGVGKLLYNIKQPLRHGLIDHGLK